jgi:Arc/MetJ family transcription regulator
VSRTNIVLDDDLVTNCQKLTGIKTRRRLIDHALHELLRHESQKVLFQLKGKVKWEGNISDMRKGRFV